MEDPLFGSSSSTTDPLFASGSSRPSSPPPPPPPPPPPAPPALAPTIQRRLMTFDEKGQPTLSVVPLVTPAAMQDLYAAAAALPYESPMGPGSSDHRFDGMPCAEVIVRKQLERAAQSGENPEPVMDRLMGKPKQKTESVRVTMTYEESLKLIAQKVAAGVSAPPRNVVDGEVVK